MRISVAFQCQRNARAPDTLFGARFRCFQHDINAAEFTFTNPVPADITTALTWSTDLETWFTTGVVPTANGFDLPAPLGAAFFFRISVTK